MAATNLLVRYQRIPTIRYDTSTCAQKRTVMHVKFSTRNRQVTKNYKQKRRRSEETMTVRAREILTGEEKKRICEKGSLSRE